jgi:hypothetical protein
MKGLKYLRYAVLLFAVAAYANNPSSVEAAANRLPSCDECDENTPCETECNGTYAEEPWETTCGDHRNWGGECAGVCQDGFCDPEETAYNCCEDCDPYGCAGGPGCSPDWRWLGVSQVYAEAAVVQYVGEHQGCDRWNCDWKAWALHQWIDVEECYAPIPGTQCDSYVEFYTLFYCAQDQQDAIDECEDYMWNIWGQTSYGTPESCQ